MSGALRLATRTAKRQGVGLKINLYTAVETEAVLGAIAATGAGDRVECVMVGDSYLMTHLGRASTSLASRTEHEWFLGVLEERLAEVAAVLRCVSAPPVLIGDLPDGSAETPDRARRAADRLLAAGADVVKLEIASPAALDALSGMTRSGYGVIAHVGYTPQDGINRRYGDTLDEALELFATARRLQSLGACGLVLERVSEPVNQALARSATLPLYSIFSGRAVGGGQSLNVWDAVFLPDRPGRYFPPTAVLPRSAFPGAYTHALIEERMGGLIRLTLDGEFPRSPPSRLSPEELALLARIDPWAQRTLAEREVRA
jgi:ketopantoate hydroxymethyltransferase